MCFSAVAARCQDWRLAGRVRARPPYGCRRVRRPALRTSSRRLTATTRLPRRWRPTIRPTDRCSIGPDLIVTAWAAPGTVAAGSTITVTGHRTNQGAVRRRPRQRGSTSRPTCRSTPPISRLGQSARSSRSTQERQVPAVPHSRFPRPRRPPSITCCSKRMATTGWRRATRATT